MTATRRLAAILAADVVGYSRLMGADEESTLKRLVEIRQAVIDPAVGKSGGRVVKIAGDGFLIEYPSAVEALRCGIEIQEQVTKHEQEQEVEQRFQFRIGINVGDVIASDDDIHGDGVNVAARLEAMAEPGGILVSATVHATAANRLPCSFDDLGERSLKNIEKPVRVYRVSASSEINERPALPLPDKPSIAVLPFQNMSGDPEQEYFADGMVEEIITALSRFRQLFVIARNSSFTYKGRAVDVKLVGRELGVRYVLEGSVRKSGNRVRITGQLIEASSGTHLWADRFDGTLEDIFELQDQVTGSVVGAIAPSIEAAEIERAQRKPTESLKAYDLLLRSLPKARQFSQEGVGEAASLLHQALDIDPSYALAYAALAYCYHIPWQQGWTDETKTPPAQIAQFTNLAIKHGGDDPEVLVGVGWLIGNSGYDAPGGIALAEKALALNPNSALALLTIGQLRAYIGDTETAVAYLDRSARLSPFALGLANAFSWAHFTAGRYEVVLDFTARTLRETPDVAVALRLRAASLALLGRLDEARDVIDRLLIVAPDWTISRVRWQCAHKVSSVVDALCEGLRRAGIPE
jgi:adenylate cyclase